MDQYDIHSIPIHDTQCEYTYKSEIALPAYYYMIQSVHHLSILGEYVLAVYYIDTTQYDLSYIHILMYSYLASNIFFNIYGFCHVTIELIQTMLLLFLCNWSIFAFIIFLSIFIFQLTSQCILGIINDGDIGDYRQCKSDYSESDTYKFQKYIAENVKFAIFFGNFEILPFLVYNGYDVDHHDHLQFGFSSILYNFCLILMIWMSSMMPFYVNYMLLFGEYFNPSRHWNHWFTALFYRLYIVLSLLFKCINIYFALDIVFNIKLFDESSFLAFEFLYPAFIVIFNLFLLCALPFCLPLFKGCFCGKFKTTMAWFICCKMQLESV